MGMLYDYFRAADVPAVIRLMERSDCGPVAVSGTAQLVDAVDAKGIDPHVVLGKLVSFILNVPWAVDLVETRLVWPAGSDADADYEGPWTVAIGDRARDALAGIPDAEVPELAARWVRIEELSGFGELSPDALVSVLTVLIALARRASAADEHLYCWMSL
jgi:hypothetical protein